MTATRTLGYVAILPVVAFVASVTRGAPTPQVGGSAPSLHASSWLNRSPQEAPSLGGKLVLVSFWQPFCRTSADREVPKLLQLEKAFAAKGLVVVGVAEGNGEHLASLAKGLGMTYPVVANGRPSFQAFAVQSTPADYLIDEKGTLVAEGLWNIERVLKARFSSPEGARAGA